MQGIIGIAGIIPYLDGYLQTDRYVHLDVLAVETNLLQLQVFAGRPVISSRTICTEDCIFRAAVVDVRSPPYYLQCKICC